MNMYAKMVKDNNDIFVSLKDVILEYIPICMVYFYG
jgi:hypothetical protein